MAIHISIENVRNEFNNITSSFNSCIGTLNTINMVYIEGTASEWNTPYASKYIESVCGAFNDFINQFNLKYQDGMDSLVNGINTLLSSEDATLLSKVPLPQLPTLSKSWEGQNSEFNIPEDYAGFTYDKLTTHVDELLELIDGIQKHIDSMVQNGLASHFCTSIQESLRELKESAKKVADEYSSSAAKAAVAEDEAINTIKSST